MVAAQRQPMTLHLCFLLLYLSPLQYVMFRCLSGVYKISVDSQQHKVVVTGNVTAENLIRKLTKSGKHAELWPKQKPVENAGGGGGCGKKKKNNKKNDGKPNEPPENTENNVTSSGDDSSVEASDKPESEAPPVPLKQNGTEKAATDAGRGKKKGKKGQKEHDSSSGGSGKPGGPDPEVASQEAGKKAAGGSSLAIPPAIDAVSYSSVHPMPILMQQQSNCIYPTAPPGSYYFSEENANACCLM
ncbi:hypothetical protein BHE74_00004376 [Ensete ventricosum]|nr:hypothetical protein BHE74_00004376 [Ensete ventricosum]RZR76565.1 hypothetical protein BHM03_00001421 [Ensete ventricosum]